MTQALGSLTIQSGNFQFGTPSTGIRGLVIANQSGFNCSIRLDGTAMTKNLHAGTADFFPISSGYTGTVIIIATALVGNVSSWPGNYLQFDAVGLTENINISAYPMLLPSQAVTATASGKPLYTATFGVNSSVGIVQTLNVFNPPNSGVTFTFHSAKAFSGSTTGNVSARIKYLVGGDLNLPNAVAAVSHAGTGNPPVSFAHVTADDSNNSYGNTLVEQYSLQTNFTVDLSDFPDNLTLAPGGNLHLDIVDSNSGKLIRETLKWSEDIAVPPQGGVLSGMAITTLVNEGDILQPVLKATKVGDVAEDITIMNDGTITTNGAIIDNSVAQSTFAGRVTVAGLNFPIGSLTRWNVFTGSANNVGTLQAHGLGVKPDFCMFQETGTAGDTNTFSWDIVASDATNVKVWTNNATLRTYIALAIKL